MRFLRLPPPPPRPPPLSLKPLDLVLQIHWVAVSWEAADPELSAELRELAERSQQLTNRVEEKLRRMR